MLAMGVRFEAVLSAGFARMIAEAPDLADPRVVYMLHEIGEETRHSRAFLRVIDHVPPQTRNPLELRVFTWLLHRMARQIAAHDTLLLVMTLAGEEIPDLLQRLVAEHPDSDPMLVALNRYHRQEEARHLAFRRAPRSPRCGRAPARCSARSSATSRHGSSTCCGRSSYIPGVYAAAGLPALRTWRTVQRLPRRVALRHQADAARPRGHARRRGPAARPGPPCLAHPLRCRPPRRTSRRLIHAPIRLSTVRCATSSVAERTVDAPPGVYLRSAMSARRGAAAAHASAKAGCTPRSVTQRPDASSSIAGRASE